MTPDASSHPPLVADDVLSWMAGNEERLRDLLDAGSTGHVESAASDRSVRVHLRFVAEAITHCASDTLHDELGGFADDVDGWFDAQEPEFEAYMERARGALALEQHLQFGISPGDDPSVDIALERRTRVSGWVRLFVLGLEQHLGPRADGLADRVMGWMVEHQGDLSRLTISFDSRARASLPPDVDPQVRDSAVDAAVVRANLRHLVTALAVALDEIITGGQAAA